MTDENESFGRKGRVAILVSVLLIGLIIVSMVFVGVNSVVPEENNTTPTPEPDNMMTGSVSFNPPAEGVTITAFDSDGNQIDSATTNKNGSFSITSEASSYRLNGYDLNTTVEDGTEINISEGDVDTSDGTVEVLMNRTDSGAYKVDSASDLYAIRYSLSEDYVLTQDVDMSHTTSWNDGNGFRPITEYEDRYTIKTNFTGSFDGNYHTISNMNLTLSNNYNNYVALFASVGSDASVSNVSLMNVDVYGDYSEAPVVGINYGLVKNVETSGKVDGYDNTNGGIVGINDGGTIHNASSSVTVSGTGSSGGIAGVNNDDGKITDSTASGNISGDTGVGGLVGYSDGTIINSTASGDVTMSENGTNAGGLVGGLTYGGTIFKSSASGDVTGKQNANNVSGFVGRTDANTTITDSSASGNVTGSGSYYGSPVRVGGFVGTHDPRASIEQSTATGNVSGNVAGTFVGVNDGVINNSYAKGSVNGRITSGFAGNNTNGVIN